MFLLLDDTKTSGGTVLTNASSTVLIFTGYRYILPNIS